MPVDDIKAQPVASLSSLYALAGAGALVNVFRSLHANPAAGTLFVDPYWVEFYLSNYPDGFRRRALVGTLCRMLFPGGVPVMAINVFAAAVLLAAFVLLIRALCRLSVDAPSPRARLFLFALCASTLTAVFYETLGDLLQLTLVLFCCVMLLAARYLGKDWLKICAGLSIVALGYFIHEASVFLLAPALPFFVKQRPRLRDFVLPLCLVAALAGLSVHWSGRVPHPTYFATLEHTLSQQRTLAATTAAAPALHWELAAEYRLYFATPAARVYFAERFPQTLALGFAYLAALALCLERRRLQRTLFALCVIVLVSLPLWCIAIDWGRFLTYALLLAVVSSARWPGSDEADAPSLIRRLSDRLASLAQHELLQLGALFVLFTGPESFASHIEGIDLQTTWGFWAIAAAALVVGRLRRSGRVAA